MERSHAEFALALHEHLPASGNLPWSPYSVASALGLAAAGARHRTYNELAQALVPGAGEPATGAGAGLATGDHLGGDLAELGRMLSRAAAPAEAQAAVANSLWMDLQVRFREEYQQAVLGWPGGALHTVDFRGDPSGSRLKINDDVAETTRGLIRDLLADGTISQETAAVIVNALYLKVAWLHPFEAAATTPAAFHAPSGTRQVPTMRQQESLRYAASGGWRMVTLPTAGDVAVDVLLADDSADPYAQPPVDTLMALRQAGRSTKVDVSLPRFRIEAAALLNQPLRELGVVAAFANGAADFSGITDQEILIDSVVHKAVLRVDEQGFEGAAATAVVMRLAAMELGRPVPFRVDRPFLLVVRHQSTGAVYFLARVVEP